MRRWIVWVLVALMASAGLYLGPGTAAEEPGVATSPPPISRGVDEGGPTPHSVAVAKEERAAGRGAQRARADEIRRGLELIARAAELEKTRTVERTKELGLPIEEARPSVELKDRVGLDPNTKKALGEQFMPLIDECIEMAKERDPQLGGMLALQIGAAGDPELGAVVDSVEFPERNELVDVELLECVRETALSLALPPPAQGGRDELEITIPI